MQQRSEPAQVIIIARCSGKHSDLAQPFSPDERDAATHRLGSAQRTDHGRCRVACAPARSPLNRKTSRSPAGAPERREFLQ